MRQRVFLTACAALLPLMLGWQIANGQSTGGGGGGGTTTNPGGTNGQVQYNNSGSFGGITTTGSGNVVLSSSATLNAPTFVNPALGTVASGNLASATGYLISNLAGNLISSWVWTVPSNITVANGTTVMEPNFAYTGGGTITSVDYGTNGTSTPSFTASVKIGGVNVTSCSSLTVSSSANTNVACTGADTLSSGSVVTVVISGVSGSPNQAWVKINYTHTVS